MAINIGSNKGNIASNSDLQNAINNQNQDERQCWIRVCASALAAEHVLCGTSYSVDQLQTMQRNAWRHADAAVKAFRDRTLPIT